MAWFAGYLGPRIGAELRTAPGGHAGFIVQAERYLDLMETFFQRNGIWQFTSANQEEKANLQEKRMAMDESLFDLSPEQTDSAAMPRTVVFSNETGSGSMTICPLFSGAELYYNDMHLVSFDEAPVLARNVIEINHCRVGRYECSFGENSCCYLAAGDFAVCAAARKKSSSCFPLRHYHGITILLDPDAVSPEMRSQMEWYGVNLNAIRQYICTENRCCILRSAPVVAHIFSELYTAHAVPDTGYLRLKVLELLHILSRLKDRDDVQQTDYFNQHQVECARRAAKLLTQKLTVHQTIEQLAQDVGLSATALKTCFKSVYGSSVYAYQKEYRLQLAQKLLTETDSTIAEIAHQIGYENPNKFSSAFRQSLGMTPTQYRKMRPIG